MERYRERQTDTYREKETERKREGKRERKGGGAYMVWIQRSQWICSQIVQPCRVFVTGIHTDSSHLPLSPVELDTLIVI